MSLSLEQKFNAANDFLSVNSSKLSEQQRLRLYGLVKQVKNGDCNVSAPPKTDAGSRAKWEAWNACKALGKEAAMTSFVSSLELYDSRFKPGDLAPAAPAAAAAPVVSASGPSKEGTLYKQRDVFKGWRARHFVLQDDFLHYFVNSGDILPKKSMQVTGCTVTSVRSTKVGDAEYFPFVISHPTSTKTYNLSADNKKSADEWIAAIQAAASRQPSPSATTASASDRILPRRPIAQNHDSDDDQPSSNAPKLMAVNHDRVMAGIPPKYLAKVETAVETLLDAVAPDADWEPLFEKNGVKALKRAGSVICVRGDSLLPYSLANIFALIFNPSTERKREVDPQLHACKLLKLCSSHTTIEYLRFKQVWPTAVRDFCNLVHWRLLNDGRVVIIAFSEKFDDLCPVEQGLVRAELILGGYLLTPTSKGTHVSIVVQTDLKGSLPSSIVNFVSSMQPMCLANIKNALDGDVAKGKLTVGKFKNPSYEELLFIADNVTNASNETALEMAGIEKHNSLVEESELPAAVVKETKAEKAKAKITEAVKNATDPEIRRARVSKLTSGRMLVLFMPVVLYVAVNREYRAIAFVLGLLFAVSYVMRLHLGIPMRKISTTGFAAVPSGRMLIHFPVDLTRLIRYLEMKREETNLEISITHLVVKGSGVAISEIPQLNGHIIGEDFYPSRTDGVDVSVSLESVEGNTTFIKVVDADRKPIAYVANEMVTRTQSIQNGNDETARQLRVSQMVNLLPNIIGYHIKWLFSKVGSFGFTIPVLGIEGFPHGVCTVVSVPRVSEKSGEGSSENDLIISLVPQMTDSTSPITVSIAGVSLGTSLDKERKVVGSHVLNISVAIDTNAGSLANCRKFCSRLQFYLNNPSVLDKVDRMSAISKEDEKLLEERAAAKAAIYKKGK